MEFEKELFSFLRIFDPFYASYFAQKTDSIKQYGELIEGFYKDLSNFSFGGKKVRAFLVYFGYQSAKKGDKKKILPISLAIELLHSFLLIHDDIIDKSNTRRSKPSIHKRYEDRVDYHYGISQAIVIGDIACFEAMKLISESSFDDSFKIKCIKMVNKILLETAYGEAFDIEYAHFPASLDDIYKIADLKTARYTFVGPLTLGALLGGASLSKLGLFEKFGLKVGLVFQMKDDFLGVFGSEKVIGKSIYSDMREGKNTILIYKTRELASESQKKLIDECWGNSLSGQKELKKVQKIINETGALIWYKDEMKKLISESLQYIPKITDDKHINKVLFQMAKYVEERNR